MSPELVLVDPVLADSEQIATRLDAWLARTEWRMPAAPTTSNARRTALAAALLVSMLVNGLLSAFLLFDQNSGPTVQPAPTKAQPAAQQMIEIPPPNPALLPRTKSK